MQWLCSKELAGRTGLSLATIYSARQYGRYIGDVLFVGGRCSEADFKAWLARHTDFRAGWRKRLHDSKCSNPTDGKCPCCGRRLPRNKTKD